MAETRFKTFIDFDTQTLFTVINNGGGVNNAQTILDMTSFTKTKQLQSKKKQNKEKNP